MIPRGVVNYHEGGAVCAACTFAPSLLLYWRALCARKGTLCTHCFRLLPQLRPVRDVFAELSAAAKGEIFLHFFSNLPDGALTLVDVDVDDVTPPRICTLLRDKLNLFLPEGSRRITVRREGLAQILRNHMQADGAGAAFIPTHVFPLLDVAQRARANELLEWVIANPVVPAREQDAESMEEEHGVLLAQIAELRARVAEQQAQLEEVAAAAAGLLQVAGMKRSRGVQGSL